MPNWPISQAARDYLTRRAVELSERALGYAQADFPLSVSQLQYAVMPEGQIRVLRGLINDGVRTIEKHHQIRIAFLREKFPELRRGAVIHLSLPEWIVVDRGTQYGMGTTKFAMTESQYLVPDFELNPGHDLTQDERGELVAWINRVIRQKRLHEILQHTVAQVINKHTPTVAHLHALWPMMCTLMNADQDTSKTGGYPRDREFYKLWKDRFRAPRRALVSYKPKPDILEQYKKLIHACDTVLTMATVLAPYKIDEKYVIAEIQHWEAVTGDRAFR